MRKHLLLVFLFLQSTFTTAFLLSGVAPNVGLSKPFPLAAAASSSSSGVSKSSAAGKYFQLEELEDKETATTELFLQEDHTVSLGVTDGPISKNARGTWMQGEDGSFAMSITRTFEAGREEKTWTDMGEFDFNVERTFTGEMSFVGACIAVTGAIHSVDAILGDREVGFFNMIDTTDIRLGEEEKSL